MDQNRLSVVDPTSNGDRRFSDLIEQQQVGGLITVLMGMSQVGLAMSFIDPGPLLTTPSSWVGIVLGGGGWLLIGIGSNLLLKRDAFGGGWKSERVTWLWIVAAFIFTIGVTAGTIVVIFT